jgi:N-acetylglutamate synthase-like GNAT family acetyltransferase
VRAHPACEKKDIRAIQLLTMQAFEAEELVKRTRRIIDKDLSNYSIFEIGKNSVAVGTPRYS